MKKISLECSDNKYYYTLSKDYLSESKCISYEHEIDIRNIFTLLNKPVGIKGKCIKSGINRVEDLIEFVKEQINEDMEIVIFEE